MSRSNIVKMFTQEQKEELYKTYLKREYKTKKALAKELGISTRTLGRLIDEMKNTEVLSLKVDMYDYSITKSQITIFKNDESRSVVKGYPKFNTIKKDLVSSCFSDKMLKHSYEMLSLPDFVEKFSEGNITVDHENGQVWYGTFEVKNSLSDQMMKLLDKGDGIKSFVRFADMLMSNPKQDIVDELYGFMKHNGISINGAGYIVAYKGVRNDYKDRWTGTIDNSVGAKPRMPASEVEHNPKNPCGRGLHAGSYKYAKGWAGNGTVMEVLIHPAMVCSVPWDCESQKMRTCGYDVNKEVNK
tara:strand:- start:3380 stop:4279 length:900 start_codon:yes stop_codon:yes gene_type:complete